jgi:ParB family chromosome partitioning protein
MMAEESKRRGLGRGLSALLGEDVVEQHLDDRQRTYRTAPIEHLHPGRFQPRHTMDQEHINELAKSIAGKGILQPIIVRRHPERPEAFEIIAGERRWWAAQAAKLHEVPVIVKELSDREALEVALVENMQRQDLSPIDEASGLARLMKEFSHTQEDLARAVGKSRSHVANLMRLLDLPEEIKEMVNDRQLTAGHARAILAADNPLDLARTVVHRQLNVRQTEKLASRKAGRRKSPARAPKDADTIALERDLTNLLGLKVDIDFRPTGGKLTIQYKTLEQLDGILHRLSHGGEDNQGPT